MPYFPLRRFFACVFFVLFPAMIAAVAQAPPPVEPWKAPHFSIEPKALYGAASAVPVPDGADVIVLEDDESYTFDETGRYVHMGYVVYKVLNQQGVENWDSISVDWEPWHMARPTIRVRVIAPDYTVHTLDPKSISEAPTREGDYKIYGDGKTLRAPFPAIAAGVVVEEEYEWRETAPLFAPGHAGLISFGRERAPVAHSLAVFEAPAALPLHTSTLLLSDLKPVRTEAAGRVTLTFEQGPLESFEPAEPNLPPDVSRFPEIEFSTGASWQAIAGEYAKIVDNHANPAAVQPIVDKLIAGKASLAEKETAILDYLDREVRYTGIEFGEAAIVPHDPAETLSHKYGDCKDKATLMVAMLRAAGIPANVALLNAGSRMDVPADLPGMGLFDHAIVYVARQTRAVDRRHRPLRAAGAVAAGRSGPAGADCESFDHGAGQDSGAGFHGKCDAGTAAIQLWARTARRTVKEITPARGRLRAEVPRLLCRQARQGDAGEPDQLCEVAVSLPRSSPRLTAPIPPTFRVSLNLR